MQITKNNVENVLRSSIAPFSVADIIKRLELDNEHESTLKTSPEKRVKVVLNRLEKQGAVQAFKFANKESNYYKYRGNFIKNLFIEILCSNLSPILKNEFKLYCRNVLSEQNFKILIEHLQVYSQYYKEEKEKKKTTYFT